MRIALGSDERTHLVDAVRADLERRGYEIASCVPEDGQTLPWAEVGAWVGREVAEGHADSGVLFCWTGTGVSIAANKVPGIRAALCADPETARGARIWNDANVLVMSLRATSEAVAHEILEQWYSTEAGTSDEDRDNLIRLSALEKH